MEDISSIQTTSSGILLEEGEISDSNSNSQYITVSERSKRSKNVHWRSSRLQENRCRKHAHENYRNGRSPVTKRSGQRKRSAAFGDRSRRSRSPIKFPRTSSCVEELSANTPKELQTQSPWCRDARRGGRAWTRGHGTNLRQSLTAKCHERRANDAKRRIRERQRRTSSLSYKRSEATIRHNRHNQHQSYSQDGMKKTRLSHNGAGYHRDGGSRSHSQDVVRGEMKDNLRCQKYSRPRWCSQRDPWPRSEQRTRRKATSLDILQLRRLAHCDDDERTLGLTLLSKREHLRDLLDLDVIEAEKIKIIIQLISKVSKCSVEEYLFPILTTVAKSRFLEHHVSVRYLQRNLHSVSATDDCFIQSIKQLLEILGAILTHLPSSSDKCRVALVILHRSTYTWKHLKTEDISLLQNQIIALEETVARDGSRETNLNTFSPPDTSMEKMSSADEKTIGMCTALDAFRQVAICPTNEDIHGNNKPQICAIKKKGGYGNVSYYLDVQFRLLREDYVRPLRRGILQYLENLKADRPNARLQDIRVYRGVQIVCLISTSDGIAHRVQFDNKTLKNIKWEASKRLMYGSLLCLSRDCFKTLVFATVAGRDIDDLKEGYLDIRFVDTFAPQCGLDEYVMAETSSYFESYQHVLSGLQKTTSDMPFQDYIVSCETRVRPPSYLQRHEDYVWYDLSCLFRPDTSTEVERAERVVPVLEPSEWPETSALCLDNSQVQAVQTALTKEFAIIQGPPGTGKTYVGLKIVEALLDNNIMWGSDRQILVVCYTNHALDQFLEGILETGENRLCRVGGRSRSHKLEEYNVKNIKRAMGRKRIRRADVHDADQLSFRELKTEGSKLEEATTKLQVSFTGILHETFLKPYMSDKQWDSLSLYRQHQFDIPNCWVAYWPSAEDISEPCETPVFHATRKKSLMPLWFEIDVDMFGELEGFGQSPIYALTPDHIEGLLIRQLTSRGQKNQQVIDFLESEHGQLLDDLEYWLHGKTPTYKIEIHHVTPAWKIPYVSRWELYGQLHGRHVTNLKSKLEKIQEESRSLAQQIETATDTTKEKLTKSLQSLRHTKLSIGDTLYMLLNRQGILRASVLINILTPIEMESFSLNTETPDDYFFAKWLGYTNTVEYLLAELESCVEGCESQSNNREEDGENQDDEVQDEAEIPVNQRPEEEDERKLLADAKKNALSLTREITVLQLSIHFLDRVPARQQGTTSKQNQQHRVKHILETAGNMSREEADSVEDVWNLNFNEKCRLYAYWLSLYREEQKQNISKCKDRYDMVAKRMKRIREDEDYHIMKESLVLGMTTTGAAKYRQVLERLKPRIIIVEEAAEVLESHIITALNPSCEHLILIGDHKQLRPSPAVYELAKHYNLELSLFERMIDNGVRCDTLELQHRMRPEIADIMQIIYPDLKNHQSVLELEDVKGVSCNVFFLDHQAQEVKHEENKSRSNKHEALFLAAFCRYLLLQGYDPSQITVLTTYSGQVFELKKAMPKKSFDGVRITTVDNYQGEENDIILLSLVRSNSVGSVGFLNAENRICVALSRARKGLFVIGNFTLLSSQSHLWSKIVNFLKSRDKYGHELLLYCKNHPNYRKTFVSTEKDFALAPEGGCILPCESRLSCGHQCGKSCHVLDLDHQNILCKKQCTQKCVLGHRCKKLCHEYCGKCKVMVKQVIPKCGHRQSVPCHQDLNTFVCQADCSHTLSCGHPCTRKCGESHTEECEMEVQRSWPCGHLVTTACHNDPNDFPCPEPCTATLDCGHPCAGSCSRCLQGRLHEACKSSCRRTLVCGHECRQNCTKACPPCRRKCENRCVHSRCRKICGESCVLCQEECEWKCEHQVCTKICGEICDRSPCNEPCKKRLRCGHQCIGLCGEVCPPFCRICHPDKVCEIFFGTEDELDARFILLQDCSHIFEVTGMDKWMQYIDDGLTDVHLKKCPKCNTTIRRSLRYGNSIKKMLADIDQVKSKIRGEHRFLTSERLRLIPKISELDDSFREHVSRKLDEKSLSQLNLFVIENQIALLAYARDLRKKIVSHKTEVESINIMEEDVEKVEKRVVAWRDYVSEQELSEANFELRRVSYMLKAQVCAKRYIDGDDPSEVRTELQTLLEKLQGGEPFNTGLQEQIENVMKRLPSFISDSERKMVVQVMGFKQGHWYKCENGHVYAIGECGGAMEESTCPECKAKIGGTQHKLLSGNTVASEMDGAKFPAWSDQANMANYDLENMQF